MKRNRGAKILSQEIMNMLKNLKITAKLGIGFGLVLLLFGIAVFFSWVSISAVQKDIAFLQQITRALRLSNDMNTTSG
ncbi:MAG: hypothetical protein IJS40_02625, partial [Synergistaceae bacterium]|nr:hypothetical protein [Synergistaceae bacterium]